MLTGPGLTRTAPSGKEYEVKGIVLYPDGTAGRPGEKKEYKDMRYMSSAAAGGLSGVGQVISASSGVSPIAAGAASGLLQSGASDMNAVGTQKVDVSISIPPQQKATVFILDRIVLDKGEAASAIERGSKER